ncbi:hypothetical protein [Kibdelosporangium philippinense]|uniref:hypothetical protein n=1 Tax=Kibdelosporangium philippinense TaxID=211113 RepID=UPI0036216EBC
MLKPTRMSLTAYLNLRQPAMAWQCGPRALTVRRHLSLSRPRRRNPLFTRGNETSAVEPAEWQSLIDRWMAVCQCAE